MINVYLGPVTYAIISGGYVFQNASSKRKVFYEFP